MKVYINGQFFEEKDAKISVFDHGLLYGDGVFEGIRLYNHNVFRLDEHLERLEYSAKAILLDLPWTRQQIADATCEACRQNGLKDGYIRLVVTRGIGPLGLSHKQCRDPQLIIIADKIALYPQEYYDKGLKIVTSPTRRINSAALPPMVKSLNYLNNIMAKADANMSGCLEAIMLNDQGYIAECTGDNIFLRHKDRWSTPFASAGALKGVTRGAAMDCMAKLGIACVEANLTRYEAWIADEIFLTGTGAELIPVVEVDGRKTGNGLPGEQTKRILAEFQQLVQVDGARIQ